MIGGAPYAVSIILTIFMGGLGIGCVLGGRLADRLTKPGKWVQAYGILELIIGLYALILPPLLVWAKPIFSSVYANWYYRPFIYNSFSFLICSILILIPVLCMGATLPLVSRNFVRSPVKVGGPISLLYAINTFGAATGVLAVGFWLFPSLGLKVTTLVAALINGLVGFFCLALGPRLNRIDGLKPLNPIGFAKPLIKTSLKEIRLIFFVFCISGFCSMAYEVAWTKVLTLIMGPTSQAFSLVLTVFITGLAAGGWAFGRISDRIKNPAWWLAISQAAVAFSALMAGQRMGNSSFLFQKIDFTFVGQFGIALAIKSVVLFIFMFVPTFLLGAAFPLSMRLVASDAERMGRSIGKAYAMNTLGGVMGAWCTGFLLIPYFGSERSLGLLAILQIVSAGVVAYFALKGKKEKAWKWALSIMAILIILPISIANPNWDRAALSRASNRSLGSDMAETSWLDAFINHQPPPRKLLAEEQVFYGDGIGGFTSIWRSVNLLGIPEFSLYVSGKADASSHGDMFTQTLLGQFPMQLHPNPKKIMVLGLASGVTAGEVLNYNIDRLDLLEINPQVVAASRFFEPWNGKVLNDPRTHLILQDAKAHLLLSHEKYDVIISEPSNPWMAGLAELFTKEFFERARDHLSEGGVLVEFLHSYQMDWKVFSLVGRTFANVFPQGMLVRTMPDDRRLPGISSDYLLVGVKGTGTPLIKSSPEKILALARSHNVSLANPLLLYRLVESENLPGLFGNGPMNTDDLPLVEFMAPKLRFDFNSSEIEAKIADGAKLSESIRILRDSLKADPESRTGFAVYAFSIAKPFPGMLDWSSATPNQRDAFSKAMETYCTENHILDWDFLDQVEMKNKCSIIQMAGLNRYLKSGGPAAVFLGMAEVCMVNNVPANAYKFYKKALESAGPNSLVGQEAQLRMNEMGLSFDQRSPVIKSGSESPEH